MPHPCPRAASGLLETRPFLVGAGCGVIAVTIWAGWLVMMKLGVTTTLSTSDLIALRFAVAGPVLLPVVIRRGLGIDRLGWAGFIAVVVGAGAPQLLVVGAGLMFAPVAHAGALYQGVVPLAVACLASVVLKERLAAIRKIGLSLVLVGAFMIAGVGLASLGGRQSIGHLLFLAAAGIGGGLHGGNPACAHPRFACRRDCSGRFFADLSAPLCGFPRRWAIQSARDRSRCSGPLSRHIDRGCLSGALRPCGPHLGHRMRQSSSRLAR